MRCHPSPARMRIHHRIQLLMVIFLLLQNLLPSLPAIGAADPTTVAPMMTDHLELASVATSPLKTASLQGEIIDDEIIDEEVEIAPPLDDRPVPETVLPVPLMLTVASDRTVLHPGETLKLTVNAWRATTDPIDGLQLNLNLPQELMSSRGERTVQWTLPELGETEIFSQSVEVRLPDGAFSFETAVVTATLHTPATDQFGGHQVDVVVGIESRAVEPPASDVTRGVLEGRGLVLRGRYGDVTLLVEEGSAETTTDFTYTDGYRWENPKQSAAISPTTTPITPTVTTVSTGTVPPAATGEVSAALAVSGTVANLLYLPLVSGGEEVVTDATAADDTEAPGTPNPSEVFTQTTDTLLVDNGVSFVRQWRLDAAYQGQARRSFDKWHPHHQPAEYLHL